MLKLHVTELEIPASQRIRCFLIRIARHKIAVKPTQTSFLFRTVHTFNRQIQSQFSSRVIASGTRTLSAFFLNLSSQTSKLGDGVFIDVRVLFFGPPPLVASDIIKGKGLNKIFTGYKSVAHGH